MPTDEHGVRQVCLSAFRELGFPGPPRGRTPSIWQTAGPSLFPTPSSPDCADHPPGGTIHGNGVAVLKRSQDTWDVGDGRDAVLASHNGAGPQLKSTRFEGKVASSRSVWMRPPGFSMFAMKRRPLNCAPCGHPPGLG